MFAAEQGEGPLHRRSPVTGRPSPARSAAAGDIPVVNFAGLRDILLAADRLIGRAVLGLAAVLLAVSATVCLYQVITRFLLSHPSTWSEVVVRTLTVWMVFLGVSGALRSGALVCFDFAQRLTRGWAQAAVQAFIMLCCLALFGVLVWYGYKLAWRVRFQTLAGLDISIAWAYAAIPAGAAFAILAVLGRWLDPARQQQPDPETMI